MERFGEIVIKRDILNKDGFVDVRKDEVYIVEIMHIGTIGGFENYPHNGTMEGSINPVAIVRIESGDNPDMADKVIPFELLYDINLKMYSK